MSKLREMLVGKQAELDRLKKELEEQKQKQQANVDSATKEVNSINKEMKLWNKKVKDYKLDKPIFIRLMFCIKDSMTPRVVEKKLGNVWTNVKVAPEPIETLIGKYEVRELVDELNKCSKTTFNPPHSKEEIRQATEKVQKAKDKLEKL